MKLVTITFCLFIANNFCAQVCFGPAMTFSAGTQPFCISSRDFNGDGYPDVVTANWGGTDVSVLLGTGTGSFGPAVNYTVGASPRYVVTSDINGDTHSDIITANDGGSSVSVLLGTGSGTFSTAINSPTGLNPQSVVIEDFNSDGHLDAATSNWGIGSLSVLLGNGSGSFAAPVNYPLSGSHPFYLTSADFNGDGFADLAVADSVYLITMLGTGTGTFGTPTNINVGSGAYAVTTGDFNRDWKTDIAVANQNGYVSVLIGNGVGSFGTPATFGVGQWPYAVISSDFNADGKLDLATPNQGVGTVSVLLGYGNGGFAPAINFSVASTPVSILSADLNLDGKLDIVTANQATSVGVCSMLSTADSLSGHAHLSSGLPLTAGAVHLFRREPNHLGLLDSAAVVPVNTNGHFVFPSLFCNSYLMKVIADTVSYPNSVATYYSNKLYPYQWDSAIVINHNTCSGGIDTGRNVTILQITPSTGPGVISGQITQGAGYGQRGSPNQVMGAPLKGVDVKLGRNPGGLASARTNSDASGNYSFGNLPIGNYFIYVDEPNYPMNSVISVSLTTLSPTSSNNNYYVDSIKVWVTPPSSNGISETTSNREILICPNPADNHLAVVLESETNYEARVFSPEGKLVLTKAFSGHCSLDLSTLQDGVYALQISGESQPTISRKVIVVHGR